MLPSLHPMSERICTPEGFERLRMAVSLLAYKLQQTDGNGHLIASHHNLMPFLSALQTVHASLAYPNELGESADQRLAEAKEALIEDFRAAGSTSGAANFTL